MYFALFFLQHWSKLQTSGKTPLAREKHAACCITGDSPQVMVVGGYDGRVLSDVWLLDVTDGSWSKVIYTHAHGVQCAQKMNSASSATSAEAKECLEK